ncbi:MAG: glycine cleavage system protein GcvH [Methylophilaceae bacterium]
MRTPNNLLYSTEHLWAKADIDGNWQAGITDFAQDSLGDIVFVEAPAVGSILEAGRPCGLLESVKAGSDLHALVDGVVTEINPKILASPELINDKPYESWIFKFKPNSLNVETQLLTAEAYLALTSE